MPINLDFLEGASLPNTEYINRASNYDLSELAYFTFKKNNSARLTLQQGGDLLGYQNQTN